MMKMKREVSVLIFLLSLFAGQAFAQCVDVGPAMSDICQGGTSDPLGGSFIADATAAVWDDGGAGGSFTDNDGSTPGTATYIASTSSATPVTLTLTAVGGACDGTTVSKEIVVNPTPSSNAISGTVELCAGSTGEAYAVTTDNSATATYQWSYGGTGVTLSSASGSSITIDFDSDATGGDLTVVETITATGCFNINTLTITVNPVPDPITGTASVCVGSTTTLSSTTAGGVWSSGSPAVATVADGVVTGVSGGTSLISYSLGSCSVSLLVTVYEIPVPTINGDNKVCVNSTGHVYTTEAGKDSYDWSVTGGIITSGGDGANTATVTWTGSETGNISVTWSSMGCPAAAPAVYDVDIQPDNADNVTFTGLLTVGSTLTVTYDFDSPECFGDDRTQTQYLWYRTTHDDHSPNTNFTTRIGDSTLTLSSNELNNYIQVRVRIWNGVSYQTVVESAWTSLKVATNAPVATNVKINGDPRSGLTLFGSYVYSDTENDPEGASVYEWYTATNASGTAGKTIIPGANSLSYKIADAYIGLYIGFAVTPVAVSGVSPGSQVTTAVFAGPVVNSKPLASAVSITGTEYVNEILTGNYTYTDTEGDFESGSAYKWYSSTSSGGTFTVTGETGKTRVVAMEDQGKYYKFSVTPGSASGTTPGDEEISAEYGPINSQPEADNVQISGVAEVFSTLTGTYTVSDPDAADAPVTATFRWLRGGTEEIPGADGSTYTITYDDEGYTLVFEVTPVSSGGYPTTGTPVLSAATSLIPISASSPKPLASEVCIQGKRAEGEVLTGKYLYTFASKEEGTSTFRWMRGATQVGTAKQYTLTADDINSGEEITFEVTPKSVSPVKTGLPETSNPLIRIILPQDRYSELVDTVILDANVHGGVYSGQGVTNGVFSPKSVGYRVDPYVISYYYDTINTVTVCTQQAFKDVYVDESDTYFTGVKPVYCKNDALSKIVVAGLDTTAIGSFSHGFYIMSNGGMNHYPEYSNSVITYQSGWTAFIDPGKLVAGNGRDELYFYYEKDFYWYTIIKPLAVDSVGTPVFINLNPAYCSTDDNQSITVSGVYPSNVTYTWTGGAVIGSNSATALNLDPSVAPGSYHITYQFRSPANCYSELLERDVIINPPPNSNFFIDQYYNFDGDPEILVPENSGPGLTGNFVGAGVIGNNFFPDIAGQGSFDIKYSVTDANLCSSSTVKTTTVRKAEGVFNDIPSSICYRDTTFNIFITDLPSGITIQNFINTKNSLSYVAGTTSAAYNVPDAGAGYDTLRFSYLWDGVGYTLSKTVFIDSIGNILITGLKENYCDYEGTASARVLVENSTGSGNFSFSGPDSSFTNFGNLADFYPSKTPTSATPYTVSYTHVSTVNSSGCRKTEVLPVTVNKSPEVSIFNTRITVNIEEDPLLLSGTPVDGVFSGKGVYIAGTDYVFNPAVAGVGNNEIVLSYTDSKGCSGSDKATLIVSEASGTINGININNQYCYDGSDDTLTYTSVQPWSAGSFSGRGITNTGTAEAVFDPSEAGKGDHEIVFTYSDYAGTLFSISSTVNVDSLGQVMIQNLMPGDEFCNNDAPFELLTLPAGGFYTGPVITGSLDPSKGIGDTAVTYTYINPRTGCSIFGKVPFRIYPAPSVSFLPEDICIKYASDSINFINNTVSVDSIVEWVWSFSDIGGTDYSSKAEPGYPFVTGGQHLVTLTATTINDCSAKKSLTVDLGKKPEADFYWKNECYIPNDSILLFDATISVSPVASRSWNFFDGGPLRSEEELKYPKETTGPINVQLIVNTSYDQCSDTVTKTIYIRPTIVLDADGYFEDFESGNGGWSQGDETVNSWAFGTPDRNTINHASSGENAWFTALDVVNQVVESSSIVSPCFDFTATDRPMIRLNMWRHFDNNRDGAALQYRIGDIGAWQYVGSIDDGINWYNSTLINGRPGGDQIGWTTPVPETKWTEARHTLDELTGKKDVKFRIAYGADGESQNNDGFAFDNIFIGERTRNILLEHFANNSYLKSSEATAMINDIVLDYPDDIINIQYHTNFPGIDSFYLDNPGDASARILFYGLTKAPYSFIDGGTRENYAGIFDFANEELDGSLTKISASDVTRRGLIIPVFDIEMNQPVISGGVLTVSGQITALDDIALNNLTMYIAVVEKLNTNYTGAAGETEFYNVFRKFIPDAGGINLKGTWTKGEVATITDKTWVIEKTLNSADIEVVIFIQNNVTKEVYQAVSEIKPDISVGIENSGLLRDIEYALYPNPARSQLTISFGETLDSETYVYIYDFKGTVVQSYRVEAGETELRIDDLGLPDGIYLIKVTSGKFNTGFKKLIITGS
jgi:hypothetical protein